MTDKTQSEALRLADWLQAAVQTYPQMSEDEPGGYASEVDQIMDEAAAELLRQHARIAELEAELEAVGAGGVSGPLNLAAPPTVQAEGWMPIETAPRDGREVLANTAGLGRIVVYWDDDESQWGTGLGYLHRDAPTHWMPLPPEPATSAGSGKGE